VRLGSRDIDYGWIVVAAVSITETVTWGIIYYGFPVFLRPMERSGSAWPRSPRCRSGAGSIATAVADS